MALFQEYKEESSPNLDTHISQVQQIVSHLESKANGLDPYENVSCIFSFKFCIKLNSEFSLKNLLSIRFRSLDFGKLIYFCLFSY